MTYAELLAKMEQHLEGIGEEKEVLSYVFKEMKGWSKTDFILHLREAISEEDERLLERIFQELSQHRPAQYITGKAYFKDLLLTVEEAVLIPRPETEELVDIILAENSQSDLKVLDIGTGSGAIALALKKARPNWQVTASDISEEALRVARQNADNTNLEISFLQSDVFQNIHETFDIIVSNPPYIAYEDEGEVGQNVLKYEPHSALFAEEDGFAIYRKILQEAGQHLTDKGSIYFEIGYKQGQGIENLATQYLPNYHCRVVKDTFGKDRMVVLHANE